MDRLTEHLSNGVVGTVQTNQGGMLGKILTKLASYEDAEEQGLLLRLPCPIGTTVFVIVEEQEDIYIESSRYYDIYKEEFQLYMLEEMGKFVFLTREEAEKALADMGV